jgi:CBS-domain-containing membrane protein
MIVKNIMTTQVLTLKCSDTIDEATELLWEQKIRILPILDDEGNIAGIISPRSLLNSILPGYISRGYLKDVSFAPELQQFVQNLELLKKKTVCEFLDTNFSTIKGDTSVMEVAAKFVNTDEPLESILVVDDDGKLLGILSPVDVFKSLWDQSNNK